ncbi:MAG: tRNA pseudouridine(55) synthase TruB [Ignavibacteria bacterium]|nr:tRNA pseudouridine(55) synthase TruB [Ignavibacteria bacterium]
MNYFAWLEEARSNGAVAYIDKQEKWTSFDCVAKLRALARVRRVGHAGTLDPLATGLLVLCLGKATKTIDEYQNGTKQYDVVIKLGATTETDDRGSAEVVTSDLVELNETQVAEMLMSFVGEIEQLPPSFSAIRHQGKRQYDLARDGKPFEPRPRIVTVNSINNLKFEWPLVSCSITCSKGTYIRSIARDLGANLGSGGYVHDLRRTHIGEIDVANALTITEIQQLIEAPIE